MNGGYRGWNELKRGSKSLALNLKWKIKYCLALFFEAWRERHCRHRNPSVQPQPTAAAVWGNWRCCYCLERTSGDRWTCLNEKRGLCGLFSSWVLGQEESMKTPVTIDRHAVTLRKARNRCPPISIVFFLLAYSHISKTFYSLRCHSQCALLARSP